jgi:hypothetical protein
MSDKSVESASTSPVLSQGWFNSRWGRNDQRGNGNLMTPQKVLEAVVLIKTGEIVSLDAIRLTHAARPRARLCLAHARRPNRRSERE